MCQAGGGRGAGSTEEEGALCGITELHSAGLGEERSQGRGVQPGDLFPQARQQLDAGSSWSPGDGSSFSQPWVLSCAK